MAFSQPGPRGLNGAPCSEMQQRQSFFKLSSVGDTLNRNDIGSIRSPTSKRNGVATSQLKSRTQRPQCASSDRTVDPEPGRRLRSLRNGVGCDFSTISVQRVLSCILHVAIRTRLSAADKTLRHDARTFVTSCSANEQHDELLCWSCKILLLTAKTRLRICRPRGLIYKLSVTRNQPL